MTRPRGGDPGPHQDVFADGENGPAFKQATAKSKPDPLTVERRGNLASSIERERRVLLRTLPADSPVIAERPR